MSDSKMISLGQLRDTSEIIDEKFIDVDELAAAQKAMDDKYIDADELRAAQQTGEFNGVGIASIEQTTTSDADDGYNVITITLTDGTTKTFTVKNGSKGAAGANGVSITKVEQTTTSTADGGTNVITVTMSDNQTFTFNVKNGSKGSTGATGTRGSLIYWGTAITGTSTTAKAFSSSGITSALVNDLYINTSNWNIYQCTTAGAASAAKWKYVGNIKGGNGDPGSDAFAEVKYGTIGTNWTENADTGVKTQTVSISGITASHTAKVDNYYNGDGSSDSYATFVEQQNQFLDFITNGFAETVAGGIKFTIFGDANTVSIPIVVEVV